MAAASHKSTAAVHMLFTHRGEVHEPAQSVLSLSEQGPTQHRLKLISLALLQQLHMVQSTQQGQEGVGPGGQLATSVA